MKKTRGLSKCYVWMCMFRNKYKKQCCGSEIIFVRIRIRLFRSGFGSCFGSWIKCVNELRLPHESCAANSHLFLKLQRDKSYYNFKLFRIILENRNFINCAFCGEIVNFIGLSFISDLKLPGTRSEMIFPWFWSRSGSGQKFLIWPDTDPHHCQNVAFHHHTFRCRRPSLRPTRVLPH